MHILYCLTKKDNSTHLLRKLLGSTFSPDNKQYIIMVGESSEPNLVIMFAFVKRNMIGMDFK